MFYDFPLSYFLTDVIINCISEDLTEDEKEYLLNPLVYSIDEIEDDIRDFDLIERYGKPIKIELFIETLNKLKKQVHIRKGFPFRESLDYYTKPIDEAIEFLKSHSQRKIYWIVYFNSDY